ncbi:helix-turn-helix domain-containing protein [Portibacter lacus]|nr:helix-turn-helix transcriptional regulator [Portibacter lacus]
MEATFGEYIRSLRKEKGLTLTKLAAKLDLDSANLSKIENGIRDFDEKRLSDLAQIFDIDYEEIRKEFITDQIGKKIYETNCSHELLIVAEGKAEYRRLKNKIKKTKLI